MSRRTFARLAAAPAVGALVGLRPGSASAASRPSAHPAGSRTDSGRTDAARAMRRAAAFTDEHVSYRGAYVWSYLPDLSTTWGRWRRSGPCWVQPPGTPSVGHSRLDAYHATGDETFYRAAERTGLALVEAQLRVPSAAGPPALPPVPARTSHGP